MMTKKNESPEPSGKLEVSTPHDSVVQKYLEEIDTVKSLFGEYLPREILDLLDLNTLEYMKEKFVDETMAKYYSDFLYKVNFKNQTNAFIFLLLEHKSFAWRFTSFQALKYIVSVWALYLANNKDAKYLPPVIPLVLYHGKKKWNIDKRFSALFKNPGPLNFFIPDFSYLLLDISHEPDENIKGNPILKILLMTLKYIFKPGLKKKLTVIINLFKEIKNKRQAKVYLVTLIKYLMSSAGNLKQEEIEVPVSQAFSDGGEIMATIAEQLIEKGSNKTKWDMIMKMLRKGVDIHLIEEISGVTAGQIREFEEKIKDQPANTLA